MIRTQIQLPDESYNAVKALAESKEMSLAEVIRRAVDEYIAHHPGAMAGPRDWTFPVIEGLEFVRDFTPEELKQIIEDDRDAYLMHKIDPEKNPDPEE